MRSTVALSGKGVVIALDGGNVHPSLSCRNGYFYHDSPDHLIMMAESQGTIEDFFAGKPDEFRLFTTVRRCVESLGDVRTEASKTQISFGTTTQFAWVWFPPRWAKDRPEKSIVLSFSLPHRIGDPRIVQSVEPYPGRWMHHVVVHREADVDHDVCTWLAEARAFAETRKSRKGSRG